jgi:HD-GYP domain-containing protein (c-di-GMP phosphodiesterase class II)
LEGLLWEFEGPLRVGRAASAELVLDDVSINPQHAEIVPTAKGWVVRDLGSVKGTFVNGVRLEKAPRPLQQDDVVQFSNMAVRVTALDHEMQYVMKPTAAPARLKRTGAYVTVQAVAERSWEQGLHALAIHDDGRLQQGKHFLTLLRAGYHLTRIGSLDDMLQSVLDDVVAVLNAQRGAVVLAEPTSGQLQLRKSSLAHQLRSTDRLFSHSLARRCFVEGQSLLCSDVSNDAALSMSNSIARGGMASIICALLRSPQRRLGVLHLDRGPLQPQFTQDDFHLADAIGASIAVGIENALLLQGERDRALDEVVALIRRAVEVHDPQTARHQQRVATYARALAEAMRLPAEECKQIEAAAALHDLGKLAVPPALLQKPGPLAADEMDCVKGHPVEGESIAALVSGLAALLPVIRNHHERWDGKGYPDGLAGEGIPRPARIVAVANAFDAMTSDQPHRRAMSCEQAFEELQTHAGTQFDPKCIQAFLTLQPRLEAQLAQKAGSARSAQATSPAAATQAFQPGARSEEAPASAAACSLLNSAAKSAGV